LKAFGFRVSFDVDFSEHREYHKDEHKRCYRKANGSPWFWSKKQPNFGVGGCFFDVLI
jgi:hypothetical protein